MTNAHVDGGGRGERVLARLQALLVESDRLEDFLEELVTLTAQALPVPAHCSVTLSPQGGDHPTTAAASDPEVELFDQRQYEIDDGPCLSTLRTGTPHDIPDLEAEDRFGPFPDLCSEYGMCSMLSLPLTPPRQQVCGVMNLYSSEPNAFTEPVREQAALFAGHASGALGVALKIAGQMQFSLDLQRAMASRTVIDQALGIIMSQRRCGAEQAFDVLTRLSQQRNTKLREVASDIVTQVGGSPPAGRPLRPRGSAL
ncbi:ANTAR domain-containing protein [Streptomyces sp. NPDC051636]|uniref:GAF and ANTAR domain-containing protein n=1 Tax=Streptomyces sp. NPDC051636 TaxID=3365663 RepID=UPI0037B1B78F